MKIIKLYNKMKQEFKTPLSLRYYYYSNLFQIKTNGLCFDIL